jgi:hypothetical protein
MSSNRNHESWFRLASWFATAIVIFAALGAGSAWAQADLDSAQPFILKFPHDIDTINLWIDVYVTGIFGGAASFIRSSPGVWDYRIETTHEGHPVKIIKVILYVPGYQAQTMDLTLLLETAQRIIEVHPIPLGTVQFAGRVEPLPHKNLDVLTVSVRYSPEWLCEFFNLRDCGYAPLQVASSSLDKDGHFRMLLPDFAHDQTIAAFNKHGSFTFWISDAKGNIQALLKRQNESRFVEVSDKYPNEVDFGFPTK